MSNTPDRDKAPPDGSDGRVDLPSWLAVGGRLLRQIRGRRGRRGPEVIRGDEKALLLFDVAQRLGEAGREDQAAVRELQRIAGGRRATLEGAEQLTRVAGQHLDHADINRAHRLLKAALDDAPLAAADRQQQAHFELLDEVLSESRPDDELWQDLIKREPRLGRLRDEARNGKYGPQWKTRPGPCASDARPDPSAQLASARGSSELVDAIESLAGPEAATIDPVITARRTQVWAHRYLQHERPDQTTLAPE